MKMPFLEMLLFKKCLIGVLRFFLTKITAFILRKVIAITHNISKYSTK